MKKLFYIITALIIQHSPFNIHHLFAQTLNDNIGSGNCLEFDGNNDWVQVGTTTSDFNFMHQPNCTWSFSWWQNLNVMPDEDAVFESGEGVIGPRVGTHIKLYPNIVWLRILYGNNLNVIHAGIPVNFNIGDWEHFTVTYDQNLASNNYNLYHNGNLVGSANKLNDNNSSTNHGQIAVFGRESIHNIYYFDGLLDEISVWNRVLTVSEIRDNMCESLQGNETGLVSYWNMNEGAGGTITDLTSNGNDGTLQ